MAEKLSLYYKYIQDKEGFSGKVKLAQLTHIPSVQAAVEPDTSEVYNASEKRLKRSQENPRLIYSHEKPKHDFQLRKPQPAGKGFRCETRSEFCALSFSHNPISIDHSFTTRPAWR